MRILYLAHRVPYPPNKGDKIRAYHHLRHLAERHTVHLLSFYDQAEDAESAGALREYCSEVVLVRLYPHLSLFRGAYALASGRSLSEGYFGARAMQRAVQQAVSANRFDVGWAFSSVMARYLAEVKVPVRVVDFVDVDSEKWRQFAGHSRGPLRWGYGLEARRLRAFETEVGGWADHALFVSNGEASLFESFCPQAANVRVIPNGVDTEYFKPPEALGVIPANAGIQSSATRQSTVLFTGALDYRPNIDAVLFFTREVLPLLRRQIPEVRFLAVGHRPSKELWREVKTQGGALQIAGSVPDVRPYFGQASVYVAPLRLGRGVQNKILEAMAMRLPVVGSPLALEGLEIQEGTHALVAPDAEQFAAAVVSLLRDEERRQRLADAAFHLVEQRYGWAENLKALDECLRPRGGTTGSATEKVWAACSA